MTTNVPLSRTPAGQRSLLCESGPIYVVSFCLITRLGLRFLHTSIFFETLSLEGLLTKAKKDPSPHEMKLPRWTSIQYFLVSGTGIIIIIVVIIIIIVVVVVVVVIIIIIIIIIIYVSG